MLVGCSPDRCPSNGDGTWPDPAGPGDLRRQTGAEVWLTLKEAEILQGDWIDPEAGKVQLAKYAATRIEERAGLRPKTVALYLYLLRRHLTPVLGEMPIAEIQPGHVRRWHNTARRWGKCRHRCQGIPAAQGCSQHRH